MLKLVFKNTIKVKSILKIQNCAQWIMMNIYFQIMKNYTY